MNVGVRSVPVKGSAAGFSKGAKTLSGKNAVKGCFSAQRGPEKGR